MFVPQGVVVRSSRTGQLIVTRQMNFELGASGLLRRVPDDTETSRVPSLAFAAVSDEVVGVFPPRVICFSELSSAARHDLPARDGRRSDGSPGGVECRNSVVVLTPDTSRERVNSRQILSPSQKLQHSFRCPAMSISRPERRTCLRSTLLQWRCSALAESRSSAPFPALPSEDEPLAAVALDLTRRCRGDADRGAGQETHFPPYG